MSTGLKVYVSAGERYVYQVASETNPKVRYRCDLMANNGAGWCQCVDFGTRRQPAIDAGLPKLTRETRCKHLSAVHHHFLSELLTELSRIEDGKQ
jgi:hypothetical protein